jgi:hypothetical protein
MLVEVTIISARARIPDVICEGGIYDLRNAGLRDFNRQQEV